jgi:hypothetical protein
MLHLLFVLIFIFDKKKRRGTGGARKRKKKSTETATIYRTCQTTKGKEMVASIRSQTEFEFSV